LGYRPGLFQHCVGLDLSRASIARFSLAKAGFTAGRSSFTAVPGRPHNCFPSALISRRGGSSQPPETHPRPPGGSPAAPARATDPGVAQGRDELHTRGGVSNHHARAGPHARGRCETRARRQHAPLTDRRGWPEAWYMLAPPYAGSHRQCRRIAATELCSC
jgi:hypothetical protein